MTTYEAACGSETDFDRLATRFESAAARAGFDVSQRMTLKTRKGAIHWHVTSADSPGTLEFTIWPPKRRAWFSVHANRDAQWIESARKRIQSDLSTD